MNVWSVSQTGTLLDGQGVNRDTPCEISQCSKPTRNFQLARIEFPKVRIRQASQQKGGNRQGICISGRKVGTAGIQSSWSEYIKAESITLSISIRRWIVTVQRRYTYDFLWPPLLEHVSDFQSLVPHETKPKEWGFRDTPRSLTRPKRMS